jgi:hypothetical protein
MACWHSVGMSTDMFVVAWTLLALARRLPRVLSIVTFMHHISFFLLFIPADSPLVLQLYSGLSNIPPPAY